MASPKLLLVAICLVLFLPSIIAKGYTRKQLEQMAGLTEELEEMQQGNHVKPFDSTENKSTATEPNNGEKISLGLGLHHTLTDIKLKESDDVDWFDKCMRDVMRGKFGHGKYHFTEYKFCKGWFGKKFSDEVELITIKYFKEKDTFGLGNGSDSELELEEELDSNEKIREEVRIQNLHMNYFRDKENGQLKPEERDYELRYEDPYQ